MKQREREVIHTCADGRPAGLIVESFYQRAPGESVSTPIALDPIIELHSVVGSAHGWWF